MPASRPWTAPPLPGQAAVQGQATLGRPSAPLDPQRAVRFANAVTEVVDAWLALRG